MIKCIKEKEKEGNIRKGVGGEREEFLRRNGYSSKGVEDMRKREMNVVIKVKEREEELLG